MQFLDFDRWEYWKKAQGCIAQGALTNSKHPNSHVFGVYPTHLKRGNGAFVYDFQGTPYLDYICGLGTNLLGYAFPALVDAVGAAARDGFSHSLPTVYEVDTAEKLKEFFVFVDKWKFLLSGTEACNAALRMARAHTGRHRVYSAGYHGWGDDFTYLTKPAHGVPDRDCMDSLGPDVSLDDCAAVIVEPVITEWNDDRIRWLTTLRQKCTKAGCLLIFDEIITGFRFDKYSVAARSGVIPDLIVIGKGAAGGVPFAAVGGKAKVMDGPYFVSTTYAGNSLGMAACMATMNTITRNPLYRIDRLWEAGERFMNRFNKEVGQWVTIRGYPTRGVFEGEPEHKALLFQEACKAGILLGPSWFYNFALMEYDTFFFTFLADFRRRMQLGEIKLEGNMPQSPFAQKVRENGRTTKKAS